MWPNFLLHHKFCQHEFSRVTGRICRTGHVFAFQTADLGPYHDRHLSSPRPDEVIVSIQLDSQEATSPHFSSCDGGRVGKSPDALVSSDETPLAYHQKREEHAFLEARSASLGYFWALKFSPRTAWLWQHFLHKLCPSLP